MSHYYIVLHIDDTGERVYIDDHLIESFAPFRVTDPRDRVTRDRTRITLTSGRMYQVRENEVEVLNALLAPFADDEDEDGGDLVWYVTGTDGRNIPMSALGPLDPWDAEFVPPVDEPAES